MRKFDGILLCTDMDGTLLNSDSRISEGNKKAIEYFMANGGKFTYTTGRTPQGIDEFVKEIMPNHPSVVYNGSGIYDFRTEKALYAEYLDDEADDVIDMVIEAVPQCGILSVCTDIQYCSRDHEAMDLYYRAARCERMELRPHRETGEAKKKFVIIAYENDIEEVSRIVRASEYYDKYNCVRTNSFLYEILPKGISKGSALRELVKICGSFDKIVMVGDGENDLEAVKYADVGVAVANAMDCLKEAADYIAVSNDEDAIKDVIEKLEKGII